MDGQCLIPLFIIVLILSDGNEVHLWHSAASDCCFSFFVYKTLVLKHIYLEKYEFWDKTLFSVLVIDPSLETKEKT